jgi:hypothetical protein
MQVYNTRGWRWCKGDDIGIMTLEGYVIRMKCQMGKL